MWITFLVAVQTCNCLTLIRKSDSLKPYGMFQPSDQIYASLAPGRGKNTSQITASPRSAQKHWHYYTHNMWTATQYTLIVLITIAINIPSLSGQSDYVKTLSTALVYIKFRSVENTYSRFGATSIKELFVRYRITQVGLQKILTQPCRRLICHLHAILKHSYWKLNKQKPVQRLKVYLTLQGNSYGNSYAVECLGALKPTTN